MSAENTNFDSYVGYNKGTKNDIICGEETNEKVKVKSITNESINIGTQGLIETGALGNDEFEY